MVDAEKQKKIGSIFGRLGMATVLGSISGASISPAIATVDRAIVENLSGATTQTASLVKAVKEFSHNPVTFVRARKEIRWVFFVYGSTYTTANCVEILCKEYGIPVAAPKFMIVSTVNILSTVVKDRFLARMFGNQKPKPVPPISYGLWAFRDSMTIMFSFIVPPKIVAAAEKRGYNKKRTQVIAQFACPIFLQIFTAPIHILGFDIYNNPGNDMKSRFAQIKKQYAQTVQGRMLRMVPAFGFGGIINLKMMEWFKRRRGIE